ncbi:uncharacterized protein K452DRAFT_318988 [Aplosporella prunicola CBS 121167]|uniref:Uncharacterized protein n=1 Tax=Aplosporella prunicola CBS 121167 TaxID=1176127 RepID=A0A6A6BFT0_9PEZI|nr:uncharacterized protein K452DRAFT_318988 [Aplosporella prunicola CBS 121167]KAF2141351.1 hypothetical protein K452DRAFT_318988 [Aplosporella prunicola CBS 121167]
MPPKRKPTKRQKAGNTQKPSSDAASSKPAQQVQQPQQSNTVNSEHENIHGTNGSVTGSPNRVNNDNASKDVDSTAQDGIGQGSTRQTPVATTSRRSTRSSARFQQTPGQESPRSETGRRRKVAEPSGPNVSQLEAPPQNRAAPQVNAVPQVQAALASQASSPPEPLSTANSLPTNGHMVQGINESAMAPPTPAPSTGPMPTSIPQTGFQPSIAQPGFQPHLQGPAPRTQQPLPPPPGMPVFPHPTKGLPGGPIFHLTMYQGPQSQLPNRSVLQSTQPSNLTPQRQFSQQVYGQPQALMPYRGPYAPMQQPSTITGGADHRGPALPAQNAALPPHFPPSQFQPYPPNPYSNPYFGGLNPEQQRAAFLENQHREHVNREEFERRTAPIRNRTTKLVTDEEREELLRLARAGGAIIESIHPIVNMNAPPSLPWVPPPQPQQMLPPPARAPPSGSASLLATPMATPQLAVASASATPAAQTPPTTTTLISAIPTPPGPSPAVQPELPAPAAAVPAASAAAGRRASTASTTSGRRMSARVQSRQATQEPQPQPQHEPETATETPEPAAKSRGRKTRGQAQKKDKGKQRASLAKEADSKLQNGDDAEMGGTPN